MKSFTPKNIDLIKLIENNLCAKCVHESCDDFCIDALDVKRKVVSMFIELFGNKINISILEKALEDNK